MHQPINKIPPNKKCHIMFKKWVHPLTTLNNPEDEYEEEYSEDKESEYVLEPKRGQILIDMMGLADFKFYIGYTDFKINKTIFNIIDNIEGVESLEQYTPYRLRISVGKLFDDQVVIANINKNISRYLQIQNLYETN